MVNSVPSSLGPEPRFDDAAVGIETAGDVGSPAIAQSMRAGQPGFGRGNGRLAAGSVVGAGACVAERRLRCGGDSAERRAAALLSGSAPAIRV